MEELRKPSAPYGHACVNCVKAKCRCIKRDGNICERCHRLSKDCTPTMPIRKRSAKASAASKRSQLEDKLDDIVTLLRTQNVTQPGSATGERSIPTPSSTNPSPEHTSTAYTSDVALTEHELANFRENHLLYFPFVHLPSCITVEHLQSEKPIFCLAIRAACTKAISHQKALSTLLREKLASKILVTGERSMDLLLSLVVCLTCPFPKNLKSLLNTLRSTNITHGKPFLGIMSGLAKSLVSDMRLDRSQNPSGCPSIGPHYENNEPRTNEGRRALIAIFALSTMISTTFRYDLAHWSYPIEEACDRLDKDEEAEGDWILVNVARIARITLNAAEVARRASDNPRLADYVLLSIGPLKSSLDNLKDALTAKSLEHSAIIAYLYNAEVNIYELSLLQSPPSYQHPSDFKRIEYLTCCMHSCKAAIDYFLTADADIAYIPCPSMLIFAYSIKVLYKLSTLHHDSGWNPDAVRKTVDIVRALEQAAAIAERSNARIKEQTGEDSVLAAAATTMRSTAPKWRIEGQEVMADSATMMAEWTGGGGVDSSIMDFSDSFWLSGTFDF